MSGTGEANLGKRPIHVGKKSNCLYTTNPLTGKTVWIIDPSTGKPMTARPFFVDQASGYYFVADPESGSCSWIIDPVTGGPMVHTPKQQDVEPAMPEAAPQQAIAEQAAPQQTADLQAALQQVAPEQIAPQQAVPEQATAQQVAPEQVAPQQTPDLQAALQQMADLQAALEQVAAQQATAQQTPDLQAVQQAAPQLTADLQAAPVQADLQQAADLQAALQQAPAQQVASQQAVDMAQIAQAAPSQPVDAPAQEAIAEEESDFLSTAPQAIQIPGNAPTSGLAITSLVLGVVAVATAFLPIVNNASFFIGLLGFIFAIAGLVATRKGKKRGRTLAVSGLILGIASVVIVLMTQSFYMTILNDFKEQITHGATPVATSSSSAESQASGTSTTSQSASSTSSTPATSGMSIGQACSFDNGLTVCVDRVQPGVEKYNGATVTEVVVTYWNSGSSNVSFNAFEWRAQDSSGAIRDNTYYSNSTNDLSSGSLAPGGTVTGSVYFDGNITRVYYYSNGMIQSESDVYWNVG